MGCRKREFLYTVVGRGGGILGMGVRGIIEGRQRVAAATTAVAYSISTGRKS